MRVNICVYFYSTISFKFVKIIRFPNVLSCLQDRKLRSWKRCLKGQISLEAGASQNQVRSDPVARLCKSQKPWCCYFDRTQHSLAFKTPRVLHKAIERISVSCSNVKIQGSSLDSDLSPPISRGGPWEGELLFTVSVYWTSSFSAVCEPTQSPPDTPSASSHWRLPVRSGTLWNVAGVSINGARLLGGAANRLGTEVSHIASSYKGNSGDKKRG